MKIIGIAKAVLGIGLTTSAMVQIINYQTWWFIQNVNLIFHEAGHIIFMFFGQTLHIFGGSLLEILIPAIVVVHFFITKQIFSASVASWWLSTALLSVSIYASDAQERTLSLITNDISTHDWYNLLNNFGLLKYDDWFGSLFLIGALLSVALMIFLLSKDEDLRSLLRKKTVR